MCACWSLFGDPHLLMFQSDLFQGDQGICEAGLPFEDCGIGALKRNTLVKNYLTLRVKLKINSHHGSLDRLILEGNKDELITGTQVTIILSKLR